jgi:plastocyanin
MKRWLALLLACLALGLVVAGCGDDEEEGGDDAQNTEQPAEEGSAGGGGGADEDAPAEDDAGGGGGGGSAEVSMEGIKFNPAQVTVKSGDTVTWTNNDTVGHDVTGDSFKSGDAGGLANGDTFEFTFDKAGTFDYVCTVHPGMEGSVTVE